MKAETSNVLTAVKSLIECVSARQRKALTTTMAGNWKSAARRLFIFSAGGILAITGAAKALVAFGNVKVLAMSDPIIGMQLQHLMLVLGVFELAVAAICLSTRYQQLAISLVAWLATSFAAYRIGLWLMVWKRPCPCLGNLTDTLHISPQLADSVMKAVLAYLLIGSYAILFHQWLRNRKPVVGKLELENVDSRLGGGS